MPSLRRQQQESTAQAGASRDALAGGRARRASVEQILNERSYTADAVQKLFASSQNGDDSAGFRAVGVLADYAEVEQEYESAIEQFLRDELEYVVVETFDVARAGIAMLRDEVGGRATFFVDSLRKLNVQPNEPAVPSEIERETVSRLDRLVEFRDPLGPAAKQFLPRLQSAFLVEESAVAERLARENPAYSFVTPDGTTYQGRVVSGGRPSETGPLGMKRELRALDAEVLQLERTASEAQAALQQIEEELRASEVTLEQAAAQHVESEKLAVAATLQRDQARGDMVRLGIELSDCQTELARLRNDAAAAQRRAEAAQQRRGEVSNARTGAEQEIVQAMEQQITLRQTAQAKQEELASRRAEMAALAERLASAETIAARITHELQELVARRDRAWSCSTIRWCRNRSNSRRRPRTITGKLNRFAPKSCVWKRAARSWSGNSTPRARGPRRRTTRFAWRGKSSAISARSAASSKSSARATNPSASTCGNPASRS